VSLFETGIGRETDISERSALEIAGRVERESGARDRHHVQRALCWLREVAEVVVAELVVVAEQFARDL
jgi:hypothetical protein